MTSRAHSCSVTDGIWGIKARPHDSGRPFQLRTPGSWGVGCGACLTAQLLLSAPFCLLPTLSQAVSPRNSLRSILTLNSTAEPSSWESREPPLQSHNVYSSASFSEHLEGRCSPLVLQSLAHRISSIWLVEQSLREHLLCVDLRKTLLRVFGYEKNQTSDTLHTFLQRVCVQLSTGEADN